VVREKYLLCFIMQGLSSFFAASFEHAVGSESLSTVGNAFLWIVYTAYHKHVKLGFLGILTNEDNRIRNCAVVL
jgi:hypothetical protein